MPVKKKIVGNLNNLFWGFLKPNNVKLQMTQNKYRNTLSGLLNKNSINIKRQLRKVHFKIV